MNRKKLVLFAVGLAILVITSGGVSLLILSGGNKDPSLDKIRIACVGDSITNGTYYPGDLWMMFGIENYTVGNFGVDGSAVSLDSGNPYMFESAFQKPNNFNLT